MATEGHQSAEDSPDSDDSMKGGRPIFSAEKRACEVTNSSKTAVKGLDPEKIPLRILLMGRSRSGKSASGNTIFGQTLFKSPKRCKEKVTTTCEEHTCSVCEREVCVIDTPDLLDPNLTEDQLRQEKEKLISLCTAGLHAVLFVVSIGKDLQNEVEMLEFTKRLLGEEILKFVIVLFTMGDKLNDDETLEDYIQSQEKELQQLVEDCANRKHVFNNMEKEKHQVNELLQKIDCMVNSNRGIFKRRRSTEIEKIFSGSDKKPELRLVLLGKTGVGKSASGNTILGRRIFQSDFSSASKTKQCSVEKMEREGKDISVIDTPGLFDNVLTNEEVTEEILRSLTLASPGPHAFLIVISLGRFTPEEKSTVQAIKDLFGENATKYTMVLFTHKDMLERKNIDQFLREGDKDLNQLVKDCDGRFHCFNNTSQNYNEFTDFLAKVDRMVSENENTFYSSELFQDVEEEIQAIQKDLVEEKLKKHKADNPDMPKTEWQKIYWKLVEDSRQEAKENVFKQMCAVVFAKVSGKLNVTDAEKESAIEATERKGISRSKALHLAVKATRKLAVRMVCKSQ